MYRLDGAAPFEAHLSDALLRPWTLLSKGIFATLHGVTSRYDERYPCAAEVSSPSSEERLARAFGRAPGVRSNDGVVPLRSQLWGKLVWAGYGDHLDVLGHFKDDAPELGARNPSPHIDWLSSGSSFGRREFAAMVDAIAEGLVTSARRTMLEPTR